MKSISRYGLLFYKAAQDETGKVLKGYGSNMIKIQASRDDSYDTVLHVCRATEALHIEAPKEAISQTAKQKFLRYDMASGRRNIQFTTKCFSLERKGENYLQEQVQPSRKVIHVHVSRNIYWRQ